MEQTSAFIAKGVSLFQDSKAESFDGMVMALRGN
jgi:hypothetical protein